MKFQEKWLKFKTVSIVIVINKKKRLCFCNICLAGLGEFRIRDLNDEINKLLREKRHWEERIKELGGPDYNVRPDQMMLSEVYKESPCNFHIIIMTKP